MKTVTVPILLTLAFYLIQDAASGDENQDPCSEFRVMMKTGKLFCLQDKNTQSPDEAKFISKCTTCKMILEQEATSQKKARHLSRAPRAIAPAKLNCEDFKKGRRDGDFICTADASPVCGTDGKTYRNKCELCAENEKSKNPVGIKGEGECDSNPPEDLCSDFRAYVENGRLGCTRESDPIRGPDGRTHGNRCAMCAEFFLKEAEANATHERENRIRRDAEKELCKEFENQVRRGRLFCTRESDPIRGPDGKIHGNKCALCAEIFMKNYSEQKSKAEKNLRNAEERAKAKKEIKKRCSEFQDRAKSGTLFCTRENDPIRGLDGKTHGNLCSMCQDFFKAEAEEKKKAETDRRNKRGSKEASSYADLCSDYRKSRRNGQLYCTKENDPIKGPDGKMHGNTCSMCQAFFIQEDKARAKTKREAAKETCSEFRDQAKDGMFICTRENAPVVGPDGKLHANKCAMCASVFQLEEEEKKNNEKEEKERVEAEKGKREAVQELCSKYRPYVKNGLLPCPRNNDPIEGLDGKIHENICSMCEAFFQQEAKENEAGSRTKAKRDLKKVNCSEFRGLLENGELYCTRENDPVRGPDGKTHGNKCAMCKAVFEKENEDRRKKEGENQRITSGNGSGGGKGNVKEECAQYWESMKNGQLSCTRESDPVRDADGKSYNNKCMMCKELLQKEIEEGNKNSGSRSNGSGKDICDQFRSQMKNGKLLCTRESDPTRGPDGKTHGNKCAMCKERLEREAAEKKKKEDEDKRNREKSSNNKEDRCHEFRSMQQDGRLICTRENDPVRGPDGKMHVNKCAMCQTIFEREANERKRSKEEKSRSKPENDAKDQCGGQNKAEDPKLRQPERSFASIARISIDECSEFRKLMRNDELICTQNNDLVDGAAGWFDEDLCYKCRDVLEQEGLEKLQEKSPHIRASKEEHSADSLRSSLDSDMCKHYRLLPRIGYLCPKNFQFVCGDDGQTYNNPCMLCHENLMRQTNTHIKSVGKCEESTTPEPDVMPASEK